MSEDGSRIFFLSPDPIVGDPGRTACGTAVGTASACPPQLFVRQYDDVGNPTVRWISRAEPPLFEAPQQIGEFGNGVGFEGASADGQVVYFRTNAPLVGDDPNGGDPVIDGSASPNSWDLYRYELPGDNTVDPAGGALTRVSGGPGDNGADPNTNCTGISGGNCATAIAAPTGPGVGAATRFISDDGDRVYFVTAARIPAADNARPVNGSSDPTATDAQVNSVARNLYLYDHTKDGASAYKFIARLPFAVADANGNADACASANAIQGGPSRRVGKNPQNFATLAASKKVSCVHGSSSGDAIAFETTGQLTSDDTDGAVDVYVYDADLDEIVRVSAPPAGGSAYPCMTTTAGTTTTAAVCNGDLGVDGGGAVPPQAQETVGLGGLRGRNIAEDSTGSFKAIYFQSERPLVDADANGTRMDVYEWREGDLNLISPGASDNDSYYSGNSRDGNSVFFWTDKRIDPREVEDKDGDLYVSRVGGGFPLPAPPVVCDVLADLCQGGGGGVVLGKPTTTAPVGGGNAVAENRRPLTVVGLSVGARKRAARTGVLSVGVRGGSRGAVRVVANARIGGRTRKVAVASKRVDGAGVAEVRLRLSAKARAVLRDGRVLRVTLLVTQPGSRARSATVRLQRGDRS